MDTREFEAAGLYDPGASGAADRLALLEWLAARGVPLARMQEAARRGALYVLGGRASAGLVPTLSVTAAAERTGMAVADVERFLRDSGLPPVGADVPVFLEQDLEALRGFAFAVEVAGGAVASLTLRVAGSGLASTAEAMLTEFRAAVEVPMREAHASELELARRLDGATKILQRFPTILAVLFRLHVDGAFARFADLGRGRPADSAPLAVGFVDLAGFTSLSETLGAAELIRLIERFEDTARDAVVARDGRVVKLIGDEVMFVAARAEAACDAALALVEAFRHDEVVRPRGGVASGTVLVRAGDYFGPVVNLASRLVHLAAPGEVLVTEAVAAEARGVRFVPAGTRPVRGLRDAVPVLVAQFRS